MVDGRDDMVAYRPDADAIVLPLGPKGGVSYGPEVGVLGSEATSNIKGSLFIDIYLELLGVPVAA